MDEAMQRLEAIKARWLGRTCTERERADLEEEAWVLSLQCGESVRGKHGRRVFVRRWFAQAADLGEARQALRLGGADAQPLWDRVQAEHLPMGLRTAKRLWRVACVRARGARAPVSQALATVLTEYDQLSPSMVNGQVVRRRSAGKLPALDGLGASVAPKLSKPTAETTQNQLWIHIRQCAAEIIRRQLPLDLDPTAQGELLRDFESELHSLFDTLRRRLNNLKGLDRLYTAIPRRQVADACAKLSMDPPAPHKPVNLALARRQRGKLAKHYHPDRHGGGEKLRPQYEAVIEAYALLERYNMQLGQGVRAVIDGGSAVTDLPCKTAEQ